MSLITRYLHEAWGHGERSPPLRIVDTTGSHVGWRSFQIWRQPVQFASAIAVICAAVLSRRISVLYLQTAEGGSVLRKLFIAALVMPFGVPVVLHMHAAAFPAFYDRIPKPLQQLITFMFNRCDYFIVLGESFARYFETTVGVERRRIIVIPNGVPDRGNTPAKVSTRCNLLFLGTLTHRKGLADLFEALARPEILAKNWDLTIAGAGDPAPWQAMLQTLGLADRVSLLGWAGPDVVHQLFNRCDALVLPSHDEGLPLVILEAMAHGRAVVATSVGSVRDAVTNETTGLVVAPGNVDALAQALGRIIDDPELRMRMSRNARTRYEADYKIDRMKARLAAVFTAATRSKDLTAQVGVRTRR